MSDDVVLRPARGDEADLLGSLKLRASLAYGDHVAELLAMPDARRVVPELLAHTIVADRAGRPVGFVSVLVAGLVADIEELFVDPALWRSGIGTKLIDAAETTALHRGATALRVVANGRAQAFYERCGFAVAGEETTSLEPAPVMQRQLIGPGAA